MRSRSYQDYNQLIESVLKENIGGFGLQDWFLRTIFAIHLRE
jgi:hypothetical protein